MPAPTAFNEDTGELLVYDIKSSKWNKPKIIENPQTGERVFHDGEGWQPMPLSTNEYREGLAASALQGPAMSYGDEFVAGLENPGEALGYLSRFAQPGGVARELVGKGPPVPEMPGYEKSLEHFRKVENRFRNEKPWTAFGATAGAGIVGGGLQAGKSVFGAVERALPNAGRIAQTAATGAGFGGVAGYGAGEGGAAERLKSAAFGAATGGAVGAGLQAAAPAIGGLIRMVRANPALWNEQTGQLTNTGVRVAQEAGLDPAQASAELQREFADQARNALQPQQAAAAAQARSLPVPVQLREGQVTLSPDQQMFESQAAKDVFGKPAGVAMRAGEEAQQAALRGNVPAIGQRIGGGAAPQEELGQGVMRVQQELAEAERAAKGGVDQAYDVARKGGEGGVDPRAYGQGVMNIFNDVAEDFAPDTIPKVSSVLSTLRQGMTGGRGEQPTTLVSTIFKVRRQLSGLQANQDVEGKAAGKAKRSIDRWLNELIDNDLITGDPQAVERWRAAIQARSSYGQRYQGGDLVEKLVERSRDGRNELKLDPLGAINLIFGRSGSGWVKRPGMIRDLARLRSELGGDTSPAWRSLKEEAFLRLARTGEGAQQPTSRDFSGAKFAKAWEDALTESPEVMRMIFTPEEQRLIGQFSNVARRVTTNVRGGSNSSNTSAGISHLVRRMFMSAFMGPKAVALLENVPIVKGLQDIGNELRANRALAGRVQQGNRPVEGLDRMLGASGGPLSSALISSTFGGP